MYELDDFPLNTSEVVPANTNFGENLKTGVPKDSLHVHFFCRKETKSRKTSKYDVPKRVSE